MVYDDNNVFAKIIRGEIPCSKVYEDDTVLAFHDISKAAEVHVLVVPKGQYVSFDDFVVSAAPNEVADFFVCVKKVAGLLNLDKTGYRLITNHGGDGAQTVFNFHVHILGGEQLGALLP